jgi:hypothetical protein
LSTTHTVRQGESLSKIATRYGFHSWRTIYDHPKNVELRHQRPDPARINPGDHVHIPDRAAKQVSGQTAQTLRFQATPAKSEIDLRSISILVHGVNTDASWYKLVETEIKKKSGISVEGGVEHHELFGIIPFSWGDYENQNQGGYPNYAADEIVQLFENGSFSYDRIYQGHSAVRLKELIDEARKVGVQVNVIAHSNGTLVTSAALLLGAKLDNFLMMGSPLDSDNDRSQGELVKALKSVSGAVYNFWSPQDEWAHLKGGIGGFGDNATYTANNPRIKNRKFLHDLVVEGTSVVGNKSTFYDRAGEPHTSYEFNHSDYMKVQHMPIFSTMIRKFADAPKGQVVATKEKLARLTALRTLGDWTKVSYYKDEENVTMESPEMAAYKAKIDGILRGPPSW